MFYPISNEQYFKIRLGKSMLEPIIKTLVKSRKFCLRWRIRYYILIFYNNEYFLRLFTVYFVVRVNLKIDRSSRQVCSALWKRDTQVFSYEIYKIFKNSYFEKHLRTVASVRFLLYNAWFRLSFYLQYLLKYMIPTQWVLMALRSSWKYLLTQFTWVIRHH